MNVFDDEFKKKLLNFSRLTCDADCYMCNKYGFSHVETRDRSFYTFNKRKKVSSFNNDGVIGNESSRYKQLKTDQKVCEAIDVKGIVEGDQNPYEDSRKLRVIAYKSSRENDELMSLKRRLNSMPKKAKKGGKSTKKRVKLDIYTGFNGIVDLSTLNGFMTCFDIETTRSRENEKLQRLKEEEARRREEMIANLSRNTSVTEQSSIPDRLESVVSETSVIDNTCDHVADGSSILSTNRSEHVVETKSEMNARTDGSGSEVVSEITDGGTGDVSGLMGGDKVTSGPITKDEMPIEKDLSVPNLFHTTSIPSSEPGSIFSSETLKLFSDKINIPIPQGNPLFAPKAADVPIFSNPTATNFVFGQANNIPQQEPIPQIPQQQIPMQNFNVLTPSQIIIPGFSDPNVSQVAQAGNPFAAQFGKNKRRGRGRR